MKKTDFNRAWTVRKEGSEEVRIVNLPHDAMLFEERRKDSPAAGACGYFTGGKYIYEKTFDAPEDAAEKTYILEFEGIYRNAEVFVNGEKAAEWPYGYSNFFADMGKYLVPGQENTVRVVADNSEMPNSRWYSGSGIYREVQLYTAGKEYIAPEGIRIQTKNNKYVTVHVDGTFGEDAEVRCDILLDGACILEIHGNDSTVGIPGPKLWDAEHPNLYTCRVQLLRDGVLLDEAEETFGFRSVNWGSFGLRVNGEEVLLRGACVHHDNGILGACSFADAEWRRIRILKEAGFNAVRSSHNPISKAALRACDALGMYVMDETFDMWFIQKNPFDYGGETFENWWQKDTEAMISKDYNHPSVIMYSIGNEISDLGLENGQEMCAKMAGFVKKTDPSRAVTLGINLMLASMTAKGKGLYGKNDKGEDKGTGSQSMDSVPTSTFFNMLMNRMGKMMELSTVSGGADKVVEKTSCLLDIPGYNYAGARYAKEAKMYPDRPFVGSETLPQFLAENWKKVKAIPTLTGDFMWTGWVYLGESGIGTIQYKDKKTKEAVEEGLIISGGPGVVDICGKMRPETGWNRFIWGLGGKPVIGVDPLTHADDFAAASMWRNTDAVESWSWEGCEGKKTNVTVYADAAFVKLYVNRIGVGRKLIRDYKAIFRNVEYADGNIVAVAFDKKGNEIARSVLRTARGETRICLAPDKTVLAANGQDLCFLAIDLVGKNGVTKASADQKLTVKAEGAGTLQAFGSARPHMKEDFVSDTHTTFYGKALAVIRAGYEPGTVKVTVSGEGLEEKTLELTVE